jgi:hypothetical protein
MVYINTLMIQQVLKEPGWSERYELIFTLEQMAGVITNVKLKYDCNAVTLSRVLSATLHLVARMLGLPLLQKLMSHYVPLWDLSLFSLFFGKIL